MFGFRQSKCFSVTPSKIILYLSKQTVDYMKGIQKPNLIIILGMLAFVMKQKIILVHKHFSAFPTTVLTILKFLLIQVLVSEDTHRKRNL